MPPCVAHTRWTVVAVRVVVASCALGATRPAPLRPPAGARWVYRAAARAGVPLALYIVSLTPPRGRAHFDDSATGHRST